MCIHCCQFVKLRCKSDRYNVHVPKKDTHEFVLTDIKSTKVN